MQQTLTAILLARLVNVFLLFHLLDPEMYKFVIYTDLFTIRSTWDKFPCHVNIYKEPIDFMGSKISGVKYIYICITSINDEYPVRLCC